MTMNATKTTSLTILAAWLSTGMFFFPLAAEQVPSETRGGPIPIIFDTDLDTDCDDAGALAMLHTFADGDEIRILATVVSSRYAWSAPCLEVINRYRGRSDLPIGAPKGEGAGVNRGSRYARQIAEELSSSLETNDDAADAVDVYRSILAAASDNSVTIVTVGYLTNLRDLLASGPDDHSSLPGRELVRRKVARWVCMGGRYPEHLDPAVFGNFKPDPASAVAAVNGWPGTIFFSGSGQSILTGKALKDTPEDNPVRRIYELYLGDKDVRPSWDQVALLYAVRTNAPYWKTEIEGYNHIFENGTNQWRFTPDKDHVLVQIVPGMEAHVQEIIESLMIAPPAP